MDQVIKILVFLFIIAGCKTVANLEQISLEAAAKVELLKEGKAEFFYWEINNDERLWKSELGHVDGITEYRDSLKLKLGPEKYNAVILKESRQDLNKSLIAKETVGARINAMLVHTGSVGKVRNINFLEAQILNYQLSKYPLFSHPTEFHGFIAVNEKEDKLRIYFGSSDQMWPPKPKALIKQLEMDIKTGWRLKYHLHNHYELESNNYLGILAPSMPDAQYFKMLSERFNVEKTLITNGFHTVELDNSEFHKFESH